MEGTNLGGADELVELRRCWLVLHPLLGVVVAEAPATATSSPVVRSKSLGLLFT
jgi:hypothetical protein